MSGREEANKLTGSSQIKEIMRMNGESRSRRRTARRFVPILVVAIALLSSLSTAGGAQAAFEDFGLETFTVDTSTQQAGGHPDLQVEVSLNGDPANLDFLGQPQPWARVRDIAIKVPPGFTGNPAAFPTCPLAVFANTMNLPDAFSPAWPQCPRDSQVGIASPGLWNFFPANFLKEPLYNLESPGGDVVARLGFFAFTFSIYIDIKVDPARDNAVTSTAVDVPTTANLVAANTTIWGVPTHSSHDGERYTPLQAISCGPIYEPSCVTPTPTGMPQTAFFSNPTSCDASVTGDWHATARSYQLPDVLDELPFPLDPIVGCEAVPFDPILTLEPTSKSAASPSGVDFHLHIPQDGFTDPEGLASAHLKKAVVTLPEGLSLNASSANGLDSCSQAQIGLTSESPIRFNAEPVTCPDGSKVGSGTITTPVLDDPLQGSIYVAKQDDNPFDSLLAGYLVAKGKGVLIKQAGKFDLSPSGRITAVFDNNPQQPFSDLDLHFKGGPRGVLTTPSQCGTYETTYELFPWSGNPPATGVSSFTIDQNCDAGRFDPGFEAGTVSPLAGEFSPFTLRMTRKPGSPQFTGVLVDPPPGLTGKLAGIPSCSEAALSAIPTALGTGAAQLVSPACPAASQVGSVVAGAGSGSPFYVSTGRAYLTGPYKGAPLGLAILTPAVAGPFDLGNVVVRTALHVDPKTARIHAVSDPLPTILQGVPLDLVDVRVNVDRNEFILNPTSCARMSIDGVISATGGASARVSDPFKASACGDLGFAPRLRLRLRGGTERGQHPALTAVFTTRRGDANLARLSAALPRSEFLENNHIRTVCTRVQFAADQCPAGAVYGRIKAWTPLLDQPLAGPVYLRSSSNELPDLVADLRGPAKQPIRIELVGRIDSIRGGIRNTFELVPDAPVSKVVLQMQGRKNGLLVNSRDICERDYRAVVKMRAHNGLSKVLRPVLTARCGK
jgi:hypothetical protein